MYKNYLYLLRFVLESKNILLNKIITDVFSQEKDKLFIELYNEDDNFILVIDTNDFYIEKKKYFKKAKKNVASFFVNSLPDKIINIEIAFAERLIRFICDNGILIVSFNGNKSNIFYIKENEFETFKKIKENDLSLFKIELNQFIFINNYDEFIIKLKTLSKEEILKFPFFSKHIKEFIKNGDLYSLTTLIRDFLYGKIAVGIDYSENEILFKPISLLNSKNNVEVELYDSYLEAIEKYLQIEYKVDSSSTTKKEIEKYINKEIEKVSNKLNNLKSRIENGSREKEYAHFGEILLTNINLIKKGMSEIILFDWTTNDETKIKLDPKLSPEQNINKYFEKSRSEKIDYDKSYQLFQEYKSKYDKLLMLRNEIEKDLSIERLNEIKKQLNLVGIRNMNEDKKEKLPFRHFIIQDKYHFYVGRDSKSNDQLTTKFAKQNDFWFHARSVAGSHGVLRVENTKEAIPKNILEKAASITAFYSKAKTSKLASVTYTLKKYVTKNSRHEPGQVTVLKENVLLVKPEIPNDCVYVED